jgi:DNA repair exonuclease SbcCD ATPase subunit
MAVVQFINALFGTDYPLNSLVSYPNTESVNAQGKTRVGDMIVQIEGHSYLFECQSQYTDRMIIRVFEYSLLHSWRGKVVTEDSRIRLRLPQAMVIYLDKRKKTREEAVLELEDTEGTVFRYKIKQITVLNHSIQELEQKKYILLLPFLIIKLKDTAKKAKTREEEDKIIHELKCLGQELHEAIEHAEEKEYIEEMDCHILQESLQLLQEETYQDYINEEEVNDMFDPRAVRLKWQNLGKERDETKQRLEAAEQRLAEEQQRRIEEQQRRIEEQRKLLQIIEELKKERG